MEADSDLQRGRQSLRAAAGAEAGALASSAALMLLTPPAVASGKVPIADRWLAQHGFTVGYARQVWLDHDAVRRIWKYQPHSSDLVRSRVVGRLLTSGPSLLTVAVAEPNERGCAAARLTALKGPPDPSLCAPHQLRARLGAANMFNNMVHTSDGVTEVVREAAAILADENLVALWHQLMEVHRRHRQGLAAAGTAALVAALAEVPGNTSPQFTPLRGGSSLVHVAAPLRWHLLQTLRAALPGRHHLDTVGRQLALERSWLERQDEDRPFDTLQDFRARFAPTAHAVAAAYAQSRTANAIDEARMSIFIDADAALFGMPFDSERLERAAPVADIPLDLRDRIVISTEWLSRRHTEDSKTAGNGRN